MEHVERQEERENEIKSSVDELDEQGDQLEQRAQEVDHQIGETRDEWEQKQQSADLPGAQEEAGLTDAPPKTEAEEDENVAASGQPGEVEEEDE